MRFNATEEQVKQIMANAINASAPMGMGFMHFENKTYSPEDVKIIGRTCSADYYAGRMVKLAIFRTDTEGVWMIRDGVGVDYQSWVRKYPSVEALVRSVIPDAENISEDANA